MCPLERLPLKCDWSSEKEITGLCIFACLSRSPFFVSSPFSFTQTKKKTLHSIQSLPTTFFCLHLLLQLIKNAPAHTFSSLDCSPRQPISHMTTADSEHAVPTEATAVHSLREQDNRCTTMPSKQSSDRSHHVHSDQLLMDPANWLRSFLKTMALAAQEEPMLLEAGPEVAHNVTRGNVFTAVALTVAQRAQPTFAVVLLT